jgi:hypothetical protein
MEVVKETNVARIGCSIFLVYILVVIGALIQITLMHLDTDGWFEVKPKPQKGMVQGNCDSLLRVKCDSLGIDYKTIGTTTDPD